MNLTVSTLHSYENKFAEDKSYHDKVSRTNFVPIHTLKLSFFLHNIREII